MAHFDFAFEERYRPFLFALGVMPATAYAEVGREHLLVRFGPWTVTTRLDNIAETSVTGPYRWWRAIGVRVSMRDRGLTFGSTTVKGVCMTFVEPVTGADPFGLIRHPGLTVTIEDPGGFMNALAEHAATGRQAIDVR